MYIYINRSKLVRTANIKNHVTEFHVRANNYKSTHRNFCRGKTLPYQTQSQKHFHDYYHYLLDDHNRIGNWEITIIDHAETVRALQKKELHWYNRFKIQAFFDLTEQESYASH